MGLLGFVVKEGMLDFFFFWFFISGVFTFVGGFSLDLFGGLFGLRY